MLPRKSLNVLLIGDSCIDTYIQGECTRISPEAPVPILKVQKTWSVPGMAANVEKNLLRLKANVIFLTNFTKITKTRFVDSRFGQQLLRVDEESEITPVLISDLPKNINDKFNAIVISDYNKGYVTDDVIEYIVNTAKIPVFVDTKRRDLAIFKQCFVKINEIEYNEAISKCDNMIVTLGKNGARYRDKIYPTKSCEVIDVCGCGDTFLASLTLQYLKTNSISKAINYANAAAGITANHLGNYAPTDEEIKETL